MGLTAPSGHERGVAIVGLELSALPHSVAPGIEIIEPAGSKPARPAAVGDDSAVVGDEIASAEDGGTEGPSDRATERRPGGGTRPSELKDRRAVGR